MNNIKCIMYFIKIVFILFIIKITLFNSKEINYHYSCDNKIRNNSNENIIKHSVLNNLTYIINNFDKNRYSYYNKKGFSFTSPISHNDTTFGYCSIYIKNISTKYDLLIDIINKIKKYCLNNDYFQGYFDDKNNIRICYDLIDSNVYIFKRKCYKSPKWF